uniref:Uncharacterized protein n=1 Tax=Caudovirales sp. ctikv1 TaxID=2826781 RepID=A0A8S5N2Q7_9CAUD|nr:MAG TPA: hypothetical protein [Caudovirales sp. ctikv1]
MIAQWQFSHIYNITYLNTSLVLFGSVWYYLGQFLT